MTMEKILKKLKSSFMVTRRKFLASFFIAFLSYLMKPVNHAYSIFEGNHTGVSGKLIKGDFKFFTSYQATVVEEVASLIIPSDESAGAKEAGVVFEIDHVLSSTDKEGKLYATGLKWLDYTALKNYKKRSFLDLSYDKKIEILKMAGYGKLPDIYDKSPRKKTTAEVIRIFFELIKQHSFDAFYTSPAGWKFTEYQGPPQWSGNNDYHTCP